MPGLLGQQERGCSPNHEVTYVEAGTTETEPLTIGSYLGQRGGGNHFLTVPLDSQSPAGAPSD